MYYTQIRTNAVAGYLVNGLDGLTTYTAIPGQTRLPDLPDGPACRCRSIRRRCRPRSCRRATSRSRPGQRDFYTTQFARYGLNFDLLPNYPDKLVNPRSQVMSIGAEREVAQGLVRRR